MKKPIFDIVNSIPTEQAIQILLFRSPANVSGLDVQTAKNYDRNPTTIGLNRVNLARGGRYGVMITNQLVGNDSVTKLYIQDISAGEKTSKLKFTHRQAGGAAYATGSNNRIGNRIDNINSPCGKCCPDGSQDVIGQTITKCAALG